MVLLAAALTVTAAGLVQRPLLLTGAAVLAVVAGVLAAGLLHAEVLAGRREAARDRSAQAQAYRVMFELRSAQHAEFVAAMHDRLAGATEEIAGLVETVIATEQRAVAAEARALAEARRAAETREVAHDLAERVEVLELANAEQADELAVWHAGVDASRMDGEIEAVVDLLAWEERVAAAHRPEPEQKQA